MLLRRTEMAAGPQLPRVTFKLDPSSPASDATGRSRRASMDESRKFDAKAFMPKRVNAEISRTAEGLRKPLKSPEGLGNARESMALEAFRRLSVAKVSVWPAFRAPDIGDTTSTRTRSARGATARSSSGGIGTCGIAWWPLRRPRHDSTFEVFLLLFSQWFSQWFWMVFGMISDAAQRFFTVLER